jgi:hypothetical protein
MAEHDSTATKTIRIPLTQGRFALIDEDDLSLVEGFKWLAAKSGRTDYAVRFIKREDKVVRIAMHRVIMDASPGIEVDHVNGDGFDNRRVNLRLATHQENSRNRHKTKGCRSQYKGVRWANSENKWRAIIKIDGHYKHLGYFREEVDAARRYDAVAREVFGDFAKLNLPDALDE